MIARLKEELPRAVPVPPSEAPTDKDVLSLYPVGDPHMGLLAWGKEVGADYDLDVATDLHQRAISYLMRGAVSARALIAFSGDTMHYDSFETITPTNKNPLDSDSRFGKVVWRTVELLRSMVARALMQHKQVDVILVPGNHDPSSSVFLELILKVAYENEPRVTVITSPSLFRYYRFFQVLLGFTHGHTVKMERLPILMAADQAEAWGRARHRYWWTGHIHQLKVLDEQGVVVESMRTMLPADAWGHGKGYRPHRGALSVDYHQAAGEMGRRLVTPEML
jgi:hypothetical protein